MHKIQAKDKSKGRYISPLSNKSKNKNLNSNLGFIQNKNHNKHKKTLSFNNNHNQSKQNYCQRQSRDLKNNINNATKKDEKNNNNSTNSNQLLECISARQLLSALTTLKALSNDNISPFYKDSQKNNCQQCHLKLQQCQKQKCPKSRQIKVHPQNYGIELSFNQKNNQSDINNQSNYSNLFDSKADKYSKQLKNNDDQQSNTFTNENDNAIDFSQYINQRNSNKRKYKNNCMNINNSCKTSNNIKKNKDNSQSYHQNKSYNKIKTETSSSNITYTANKNHLDNQITPRKSHQKFKKQNVQNQQAFFQISSNMITNIEQKNTQRKILTAVKNNHSQSLYQNYHHCNQNINQNVKISQNSKKILNKKEQQGKKYVPIQFRTDQFIKIKKQKISKIQQEQSLKKQEQGKQCTFKPKTIAWKRPNHAVKKQNKNNNSSFHNQSEDNIDINNFQDTIHFEKTNNFQRSFETENIQFNPKNNLESLQGTLNFKEIQEEKKVPIQSITQNNYKNKKFNFLLDLIK